MFSKTTAPAVSYEVRVPHQLHQPTGLKDLAAAHRDLVESAETATEAEWTELYRNAARVLNRLAGLQQTGDINTELMGCAAASLATALRRGPLDGLADKLHQFDLVYAWTDQIHLDRAARQKDPELAF